MRNRLNQVCRENKGTSLNNLMEELKYSYIKIQYRRCGIFIIHRKVLNVDRFLFHAMRQYAEGLDKELGLNMVQSADERLIKGE